MNNKKTAFDVYLSAVYKWGLIILCGACMCATLTFNTEKIFGLYPQVPWIATIMLGVMDVTFFIIAIFIIRSAFDENGYLKEGKLPKPINSKRNLELIKDKNYTEDYFIDNLKKEYILKK